MDLGLSSRSPAGQLVRIGRGDAAYHAFVPQPLPPPLQFDAELVRSLSDADRALGELAGLGRMLPSPHLLIDPFIRKEAVLSSRIEGTRTSLSGLYAYEVGGAPLSGAVRRNAREEDAHEVLNYVRALQYGLARLSTLPLSLRFVRELHQHLLDGVRGGYAASGLFRTSQNWIGSPGATLETATYVPPPVQDGHLDACLHAFERYLHADDTYPPLIRLALIHYQFEAIHPFLDGNGRIGRMLIALLLVAWGLLPQPLLYLSAYLELKRPTYYEHLLSISATGTWSAWLHFFLTGVTEQARDAVERAKRLQDLQQEWRGRFLRERSSGTLLQLIDSLFASPVTTVARTQQALGVSNRTARLAIQRLIAEGMVVPAGPSAYARGYTAPLILDIVGS